MPTVDLTNCDREPIHVPGSVQTHGCVLVCDSEAVTVRRHSQNAADFLGLGGVEINGSRLEALLGSQPVHELRNALARSGTPSRAGLMPGMRLGAAGRAFDVAVHRYKGNAILEFEEEAQAGTSSPLEFARTLVGRLSTARSPKELIAGAARLLRAVLQYDRVMIYEFAADGSGQVVSEAKRTDLESFLGQHFPASDIPQQARQLYLLNPIRVVSNADGSRVPIVPALDPSGEALDLSYAHLRSVSPIHCEYLRNMGVAASMSVSIIVDGALWGLIACHHYSPRSLSMNQRIAAEIFGEFFALQLGSLAHKQTLEAAQRARAFLDRLLTSSSHTTEPADFLRGNLGEFRQLVPSDGVAVWIDGKWTSEGSAPPASAAMELAAFMGTVSEGRIWATNALSAAMPAARAFSEAASGLLVVPLSQLPRDYLYFFRKELVQTIEWAGDPNKTYASGPHGDRLTPRQSFAIWKQTVENHARPWTEVERELAESARSALIEVVLRNGELLAEERSKADVRQKMLNQELNHRVKNILSLIKSIVSHPLSDQMKIETYVASLKGRIEALAFAHDQAMRASGGGTLSELLEAEVSPYMSGATIRLEGPDLTLDARAFSVMALVIHELTTNAAKYGALSRENASLTVAWRRTGAGDCEIVWREQGGPVVRPPSRQGFGSILISRSIPFDLSGRSEVDYAPDGLVARLSLPAKYVRWIADSLPPQQPTLAQRDEQQIGDLTGRHLLLVEDQFLIAMDCEDMLKRLGAARVDVCSSVAEALTFLARNTPDAAILDVNLGLETSFAVAERLAQAGIPFIFATGYDEIAPEHDDAPSIRKPYGMEMIRAALLGVLSEQAASSQT